MMPTARAGGIALCQLPCQYIVNCNKHQAHAALQVMAIKKRTNQAIQGQRLSENEDQDHAHKQLWLLRVGPA
jgi:hypothetical protein